MDEDQHARDADRDADRVVGLYRRHAAAWAADRARGARDGALMEQGWLDRFLALLPEGGRVLDVGCGSGRPIARHLMERGCAVTGVDSSPEMIALCRAATPGFDGIVADMRSMDLGRVFDGVIAWDSFFHLKPDDQRRVFAIFRAHAAPGAALVFTSGPAYGVAIGHYQGEALHHASLDPAEYRALLDAQGFAVEAHIVEDPGCGGHTVWLARLRGKKPTTARKTC